VGVKQTAAVEVDGDGALVCVFAFAAAAGGAQCGVSYDAPSSPLLDMVSAADGDWRRRSCGEGSGDCTLAAV
jgi:hypothetical protein